ncbi:MAG: diguanylate cyclase [Acetatifactor sp.]
MEAKNKGKILYSLQAMNIIPLLFFGIIIMLLGTHWFTRAMYDEVETELSNVSSGLITMYDALYPGDYRLVGDLSYQLYKGEHNLTNDFSLIDRIKEETGLEITLFYQDTRILTTITGDNGTRIIGSGAPAVVSKEVLLTGESHFYSQTIIYGTSYFSYYVPLFHQDGSVAGMLFVGKERATVDASIQKSIRPLILADIFLMLFVSFFTFLYTKRFASSLLQIHTFLKKVSTGDLNARMSPAVLGRRDELGETAQSAVNMQYSLRVLVEQDALTSLANRRSGDQRLRKLVADSHANGIPFCVAIGDIDFFKKVNDTYGHECGDMVLKNVAARLRLHMHGKGFAARWGGEEFLLVFENAGPDEACELLETLLQDIRSMETVYGDDTVKVTMTFGITPGNTSDVTQLLRSADEKLYEGKTTGRNRIIR